jgi:hypothetical protein
MMSKYKDDPNDYWKISSDYCKVDNQLAAKIGLNEAIVLRTLYELCRSKKHTDNISWWQGKQHYWLIKFPWLSERTLFRVFERLEKLGLIEIRIDKKTGNHYRPVQKQIERVLNDDDFQLGQNEAVQSSQNGGTTDNQFCQNGGEFRQNGGEFCQNGGTLLSLGSVSLSGSLSSGCGEPILATAEAAAPQKAIEPEVLIDEPRAKAQKPAGSLIFEAYREAYLRRYNVEPLRNAKTNGICSQIAKQLPLDEAIALMHFFLQQNVAFYIQRGHAIQLALGDLQALRTNMLNNQAMSSRQAQLADKQQAQKNALQNYLENREKYALK